MASWLYYNKDVSIMPDAEFDMLCKELLSRFNEIDTQYTERNNLTIDDLRCGTGYALKYTNRDEHGATAWAASLGYNL
jgi:NAD-dependent DNA ligase